MELFEFSRVLILVFYCIIVEDEMKMRNFVFPMKECCKCFCDREIYFAILGEKRHLQQYLICTLGRNKVLLPDDIYTHR